MRVVDVTERLMAEFDGRLGPDLVARTVLGCREDLQGYGEAALPELVERCARQRLLAALAPEVLA